MGFFKSLFESFFKKGNAKIASNVVRSYGDLSTQDLFSLLADIKKISQERQTRLTEYRQMLADGITLSAIELMAEDATQPDPDTGKALWITCPEYPILEKQINNFLELNFNIDTNLYAIAFNLAAFGDAYISTFYTDDAYKKAGNRVGDYFEIETAEFITHLFHYGKPSGFLALKNQNSARFQQEEQIILDEKDFIHFSVDNGLNYAKVTIETQDQSDNNPVQQTYTVKYGNSFLEAARANFKTLGLYKDLMILARLTRSQFYRLVSIDVGQADDRETTRMIKEVRDVISNSQSIQPQKSINTISSPLSTGGNVYFPTRNGKGSVSMETVGGDFNISEMADLDYFDDQYYGALKVPKQFLGQAEELPAGIGESSLTRLDIRYARTIKRLQKAIKDGIQKLIIWKFNLDNFNTDLKFLPPFEINLKPVSSAETLEIAEFYEQQSNKLEKILDIIERIDDNNKINKYQLLPFLLDNLASSKPLNDFLKSTLQKNNYFDNSTNNSIDNNESVNSNNINNSNNLMSKLTLNDNNNHPTNNIIDNNKNIPLAKNIKKNRSMKNDMYFQYNR